MNNRALGIVFTVIAIAFILSTVVGCWTRIDAVMAYNPGAVV